MATPASTPELLDLVRKSGIISAGDLDRQISGGPPLPEVPAKAAAALVKRGVLTQFQARLLLAGKHKGFRLGPYIVREQIGHGGMGAVFLAEHETLKRRVALKVLTGLGQGSDKLVLARFLREARSAAALDHPNIVRMFDVSQQGELHYLVMEYVPGQTLEQMLAARGPLPPGEAAAYVAQAASGLQHACEKGFVHRDIKPANIMVSTDGTVKILDMGLARSSDEQDKLTEMMDRGAVLGTADYVAPETAMGHPADIRSDVYSLGSTFFQILIGKPPFEGNPTQKMIAHQTTSVPDLHKLRPEVPPEVSAIVVRMLAKKPDDRFQTPAELAAALGPWMDEAGAAKAVAGLSATGAGNDPNIQKAMSGVVARVGAAGQSGRLGPPSTGRLPAQPTAPITAVIRAKAKAAMAAEPEVVAEEDDAPAPRSGRRKKDATGSNTKVVMWAVIAVLFVLVGGGAAWLALGGLEGPTKPIVPKTPVNVEPEPDEPDEAPKPKPKPKANPKPGPAPANDGDPTLAPPAAK